MLAIKEILCDLEWAKELQETVKRRAMIYQASLKEEVASFHHLPIDAYYHLPFAEWVTIQDEYLRTFPFGRICPDR